MNVLHTHISFHLMVTTPHGDNLLSATNVQRGRQPAQGHRADRWETETQILLIQSPYKLFPILHPTSLGILLGKPILRGTYSETVKTLIL